MELVKKIIIAIDGHASCGKSTLAKDLGKDLKYNYIDTGAMYRAVTLYAINNNIFDGETINTEKLLSELDKINITFKFNESINKSETYLNGENVEEKIRGMEVSNKVSPISTLGFVREKLVALQQEMGKEKCIVMDGRDIGTVVFPEAEFKLFLTASAEVRAKRRFTELSEKGQNPSYEEILANVISRDKIDSTREIAPLKPAHDSIILDNSSMNVYEQYVCVKNMILEKFGK